MRLCQTRITASLVRVISCEFVDRVFRHVTADPRASHEGIPAANLLLTQLLMLVDF